MSKENNEGGEGSGAISEIGKDIEKGRTDIKLK
jgi:hypothetical protein